MKNVLSFILYKAKGSKLSLINSARARGFRPILFRPIPPGLLKSRDTTCSFVRQTEPPFAIAFDRERRNSMFRNFINLSTLKLYHIRRFNL